MYCYIMNVYYDIISDMRWINNGLNIPLYISYVYLYVFGKPV